MMLDEDARDLVDAIPARWLATRYVEAVAEAEWHTEMAEVFPDLADNHHMWARYHRSLGVVHQWLGRKQHGRAFNEAVDQLRQDQT